VLNLLALPVAGLVDEAARELLDVIRRHPRNMCDRSFASAKREKKYEKTSLKKTSHPALPLPPLRAHSLRRNDVSPFQLSLVLSRLSLFLSWPIALSCQSLFLLPNSVGKLSVQVAKVSLSIRTRDSEIT
jgi:hypothetical protein